MKTLRRVRPLAVIGSEVGENEEDAAAGAVALRLLDERQRAQRLVARRGPRAGSEEDVDAVEGGVDPFRFATRAFDRLRGVFCGRVEIVARCDVRGQPRGEVVRALRLIFDRLAHFEREQRALIGELRTLLIRRSGAFVERGAHLVVTRVDVEKIGA